MITAKTHCDRTLFFSDSDSAIVSEHTFFYNADYKDYGCRNRETKVCVSVHTMLLGTTQNQYTKHLDGDPCNFQRENLCRISKSEWYRCRGPMGGKKHKGVVKNKGFLYAEVCMGGRKYIRIKMQWNDEQYAAGVYNAMCDYIGLSGYRNDVPKVELAKEQKEFIDKRLLDFSSCA